MGRFQFKSAEIFHHAEAALVWGVAAKGKDRLGVDDDLCRRINANALSLSRHCDRARRAGGHPQHRPPAQ
jgi:hypothetical protein